jgi:hypothetical protein
MARTRRTCNRDFVSGRSKPATEGRFKTGHFGE